MATKIGGDVILTLMSNVAELRDGQEEITTHLEALVGLSRAQSERLGRAVEMIQTLAEKVADHETRIAALEARQ